MVVVVVMMMMMTDVKKPPAAPPGRAQADRGTPRGVGGGSVPIAPSRAGLARPAPLFSIRRRSQTEAGLRPASGH